MSPLDVLVGTWSMEAIFPSDPDHVLPGGKSVFEWLKGERLLVQRSTAITGEWQTSDDGLTWKKDFDLIYRRKKKGR